MNITKAARQEIHETLERFGLSAPEREAYLFLLSKGKHSATPVANALGIPLSSAQSVLRRLTDRGVVDVSKRKSRSVYGAKDPAVFRKILEQRMREIADVIPLLKGLEEEATAGAGITVYERERATDVFNLALSAKSKTVHEIVSASDIQDVLGERFHFTKRRMEAGVRLRSLRVETHEIKRYSKATHARELREAKFLPREMTFRASMMFWDDDMTAFFMPKSEGLAWVMKSRSMNAMMRQLFDVLWDVSRRMETAE